jgi:ParB-like chromosome segregation protein Spo0J
MEELKIEYRSIEELIPYARNSRTHSDAQIAQIAASIKEFGWTNPILVDGENGIIAGHGRLAAARKLDQEKIPVIELSGLSENQKRAYIIADNKLALNSGWDFELLKLELHALDEVDYSVDITGFSPDELTKVMFGEILDAKSPEEFKEVDETDMRHKCPRCGFEFDE